MKIFQVWVLPLAAMALFFGLLLGVIPYAAGYGWSKVPLIPLLRAMWNMPGDDWKHAAFAPFISLLLVALRWKKIARAPIRGSNWGAGLLVLGVFIYCLGLKAEMQYFAFLATQILLAGSILWFWGPKVFALVSFAWLFLFFTWPLPFLDGIVALPLRLDMSNVSCRLLNLLGSPCVQSGTAVLSAPGQGLGLGAKYQIDIADPCSGLHSLFALMMMAALAGYIAVRDPLARILVFLAAVPLAIAGNVVRILLLVWAAQRFGSSVLGTEAEPSVFHLACGYAVYIVALALLAGLVVLLHSPTLRSTVGVLRDSPAPLPAHPAIPSPARPLD